MQTSLQRFIGRTFLKGLSLVVPVAVAVYVMVWLFQGAESLVRAIVGLLPAWFEQHYIPGVGIVLLAGLVFLAGLLMYPWLTRRLMDNADGLLRKIPLFGSVYSPIKDLMDMFDGGMNEQLGQPVMVSIPNTDMETLGFITRRDASGLPEGFLPEDHVVVYVQWSSQVGGYCFILPKESVRSVDMTVEQGMRWALTGGLSAPKAGVDAAATGAQGLQDQPAAPQPKEDPDA